MRGNISIGGSEPPGPSLGYALVQNGQKW